MATSDFSPQWFLILLGARIVCTPKGIDTLIRTAEEEPTRFFARDKLQGTAKFTGQDFAYLYAVEQSSDRGAPVYLDVEAYNGMAKVRRRVGQFTLNEVKWDPAACSCEASLKPADDYQRLLEAWEKPVNLLSYTGPRTTSYTTLRELGIYANTRPDTIQDRTQLEFKRIDRDQELDEVGTNGWGVFLRNKSWISGTLLKAGVRDKTVILFRLIKRGVPMRLDEDGVTYLPADLSATGWEVHDTDTSVSPPTAEYVKTPQIAGFQPYVVGHYDDWIKKLAPDLLLLPCGAASPGPDYIEITGSGGAVTGDCSSTCLNVREQVNRTNCKSLWWRFGRFKFTRGIPLLEGLNHVLRNTLTSLAPPTGVQLSRHFSESISYATGANAVANELPGLLLSAGSDVKRYGASEPARKLLVTLKTLLEDICTLYDCGWFIDAQTGYLRIEHRSLFASDPARAVDLTGGNAAGGTDAYEYLQAQLPRKEVLSISNGISQESAAADFKQASIEYEPAETNYREDENTTTRSVERLTGDVAGMVLAADSLPDDAVVILAPGAGGVLREGNKPVSAAQLVRRYWRYGRVKLQATVNGEPVAFVSTRPYRKQADFVAPLCDIDRLPYGVTVKTSMSPEASLQQVQWNLVRGQVTVTSLLPSLQNLQPATGLPGTPKQFHPAQFRQEQFA